jgi:hypothetical protein
LTAALDVVQTDAVRAFGEVITAFPAVEYEPSRWRVDAPDGGATMAFDNGSMTLLVDAAPFIAAGADMSMIENSGTHNLNEEITSIWFDTPGFDMLNENVQATALEQFKEDVAYSRQYLAYHGAMDHYNIDFGDGNMFEWAKDMATNDKDIVFALNPQPFIDAGADVNNIEGWTFATVPTDDGEADKLIKAFDAE